MEYIQALIVGLVGSFHCVGMCGPIALALPLKENSWTTRIISSTLYNFGRVITYGLLGAIFGTLGFGLAFWGLQQWISVAVGVVMILSVLFPLVFRKIKLQRALDGVLSGFKSYFGKLFGFRTYLSTWVVGLLNGFLPCGLVYIALAGAVVSNGPAEGAIYMVVFGLGTIPMLLVVSLAGNVVSVKFRNRIRRWIPVIVVIIGILFILRGLNLGIPYVSPQLNPTEQVPDCCK
jgi:sulfite exporter TauE/SafE